MKRDIKTRIKILLFIITKKFDKSEYKIKRYTLQWFVDAWCDTLILGNNV